MSTIFLHSKRKSYYHRSNVPSNLQRLLKGRSEIWRSLKTVDKTEAKVRSAAWDLRVQRLFLVLNKQGEGMTEKEREALVSHWLEVELDYAEECRATAGRISEARWEGNLDGLEIMAEQAHEDLLDNNFSRIEKTADELLESAGLPPMDHESADFKRLCRRLLVATKEYTRIEAERWHGIYNNNHRIATAVLLNQPASITPGAKPEAPIGELFSDVVAKYMAQNPRVARSAKPMHAEFKKFMEVIGGDKPIDAITKADGRKYNEHLREVRKVAALTVIKHMSALTTLFKWAGQQGYVEGANPMQGLAPSKKQAKKQASLRKPWTDDELMKVFGSREYRREREKSPARYWLPLICLFQVCRREEAGQLAVVDIQEEGDISCIRINDDENLGQSLKNEGSRRRVPVHSSLIQLGFLEFVKKCKDAGQARLFPELKKGNNGYGDAVGKWFGRLKIKHHIMDEAKVLHSLRHGGITKLHAVGCPDNIVKMISGHTEEGVHGRTYVHRDHIPLALMQEVLEKLRYDDIAKAMLS